MTNRDRIYSASFRQRVQPMGIEDVVIVLYERHLRRLLPGDFHCYRHWHTHRALDMDCPLPWPVQRPEAIPMREVPEVEGKHHHYERRTA